MVVWQLSGWKSGRTTEIPLPADSLLPRTSSSVKISRTISWMNHAAGCPTGVSSTRPREQCGGYLARAGSAEARLPSMSAMSKCVAQQHWARPAVVVARRTAPTWSEWCSCPSYRRLEIRCWPRHCVSFSGHSPAPSIWSLILSLDCRSNTV